MRTASVDDRKTRLRTLLEESQQGPIVVTRKGKAIAIMLALQDEDEIERLALAYSPRFQAILNRGREQFRRGQGISHADFWREMEEETRRTAPSKGRKKRGSTHK